MSDVFMEVCEVEMEVVEAERARLGCSLSCAGSSAAVETVFCRLLRVEHSFLPCFMVQTRR